MNFFKRLFSSSNLELEINDGGRAAAGYKGKAGDCVVRSIAIVTKLPYQKIYDDLYKANEEFRTTSRTRLARSLKQKNDSPRSGTHRVVVKKYLEKLGWQWTPTMFIGQGCKVHLKKDELPSGTLIVSCSKHITVVKDGVLHDTYDCSRRFIKVTFDKGVMMNATLANGNFVESSFIRTNLYEANLEGGIFEKANFTSAKLNKSKLSKAHH